MNATKFVKLKRNFPKLRPTVKRNLKVDKLHKILKVSEQICCGGWVGVDKPAL